MYAGYRRRLALQGITASFPTGAITALVGHNGSGKSTLLNVLAGVHPTTGGTIERRHRRRPALVLQRHSVPDSLPLTTGHVVAMGRWEQRGMWRRLTTLDRRIIGECMERLAISHLADRRFDGLSGGQRQRAFLAQALAQQSDLLLLDEPETGLDAQTRTSLTDLLDELRDDGLTIVHATHDPAMAELADHRIHLTNGLITPGATSTGDGSRR
ncbi:zinc ABC transporter ATP-binding protein AztA [Stackebrandtia endophytica]|nr:zinc ABC transporter ATP-binding protein AztA [Stackebrandtia endophytica]